MLDLQERKLPLAVQADLLTLNRTSLGLPQRGMTVLFTVYMSFINKIISKTDILKSI
jgi:hypothetical protein